MFRFIQSTPVGGDCTCGYNIILDKEYTVEEFIQTALKDRYDEWGYFDIYGNCYEYSYGELKTKSLPEDILNRKIKKVSASGGWSRMDYDIKLA